MRIIVPVEKETLQPVEWTPKGTETQMDLAEAAEAAIAADTAKAPPPAPAPAPGAAAPAGKEETPGPMPAPPTAGPDARPPSPSRRNGPILLAEPERPAGGREDVALLLLREGLLTQEEIERALGDHPPGWAKDLLDAGSVRWRSLVDLLGGVYRLPRVRLEDAGVDESALDELPAATILRTRVLPFARHGRLLCLAVPAFPARAILEEISALLGPRPFKLFQCDETALERALSERLPGALERDRQRTFDAWPAGEGPGRRLPIPEEALPEPDEDGPLTPLPLDEA